MISSENQVEKFTETTTLSFLAGFLLLADL